MPLPLDHAFYLTSLPPFAQPPHEFFLLGGSTRKPPSSWPCPPTVSLFISLWSKLAVVWCFSQWVSLTPPLPVRRSCTDCLRGFTTVSFPACFAGCFSPGWGEVIVLVSLLVSAPPPPSVVFSSPGMPFFFRANPHHAPKTPPAS